MERFRNRLTKLATLALLLFGLFGVPAAAVVTTKWCIRTYVNDCLQTEYCAKYREGKFIGDSLVIYECP